jgi:hypothetical protein
MKNIRWLMILTIALFCSGFTATKDTWIIDPQSKLAIHGSTNVNTFTCEVDSYSGFDTLRYLNNLAACELQFIKNRMTIPIRKFDCGSRQISKDFWATLKSETYPQLDINFISLKNNSVEDDTFVTGTVDIRLAGVTARYNIRFQMRNSKGNVLLSGSHPVNFGDFRLRAPEKLNGLIRVKEALRVEFHLVLKSV